MRVLKFALAQPYEPGSNPEGEQSDTTWLFVMPQLSLGRVAVLGVPHAATLAVIAGKARSVVVAAPSRRAQLRAEREIRARRLSGVRVLRARPTETSDLLSEADLVYVTTRYAGAVAGDRRLRDGLGETARAGAVLIEPMRRSAPAFVELLKTCGVRRLLQLEQLGPPGAPPAEKAASEEVEPGSHEGSPIVASTVPLEAPRATRSQLRRAVRYGLRRLGRALGLRMGGDARSRSDGSIGFTHATVPTAEALRGRALLLQRSGGTPTALPAYIVDVADAAGYELPQGRWAVLPPRGFRSQKVVFVVDGAPGTLVKLTQDAAFNARLENEYDALRALQALPLRQQASPRALFCGQHAGLLVVGETLLEGVPFRRRSNGSAACPVAGSVIDALIELAAAGPHACRGEEAASALLVLLDEHHRVHEPSAGQVRFLQQQIAVIGETDVFATTFTHGDPSTLNILVRGNEIGLVDWENAEAAGMPLWDLFYFVNAYAAWNAELGGVRYRPAEVRSRLLGASPFRELLLGAVHRSRRTLGLPAEVVAPLFFTFWMQLALREATRLPAGAAARGRYARLLADLVAGRVPPELVAGGEGLP